MNDAATWPMAWHESLALGVPALDEQHTRLLEHAESVTRSITTAAAAGVLARQLMALVGAAEKHFADEERLMADSGYPECAIHLEQHRELLGQLHRFATADAFAHGGHEGLKATRFLAEWLSRHILHADRRFAEFLLASDDRSTQEREAASRIR